MALVNAGARRIRVTTQETGKPGTRRGCGRHMSLRRSRLQSGCCWRNAVTASMRTGFDRHCTFGKRRVIGCDAAL